MIFVLVVSILSYSAIHLGNSATLTNNTFADVDLFHAAVYLNHICPRYIGCTNGEPSAVFDPCCIRCHCDPSCVENHSCCLNSQYFAIDDVPYVSQYPGVVCRNALFRGEPENVFFLPEYEFVQTCLEITDEITKLFCENITTTNRSEAVNDNIPVYDAEGKRSYGNIHCAKCNQVSVSNLIVWQPKLTCKGDTNLQMTDAGLDKIVRENNCDLEFVPPSSVPDIPPCFHDVITECNVTGNWTAYNIDDAFLCQTIDLIYLPIWRETRKYRNIFCARCNGETFLRSSDYSQCPHVPSQDTTAKLITLLAFNVADLEDRGSQSSIRARGCPRNYLFDPIMDNCMPLYCSTPYYLGVTSSTCELFHRYVTNVKIVHAFYLEFVTIVTLEEAQSIVKEIRDKIFLTPSSFTCTIGLYYQTNEVGKIKEIQDTLLPNMTIKGVYFMIYSAILNENPVEVYEPFASTVFDYLSINYTGISVIVRGANSFDPKMLRNRKTNETVNLRYEDFTYVKDGGPSHYIFTNPYDNTLILGHIDNTVFYCASNIFPEDFLDCPAFMYELTPSFVRVPDGISLFHHGKNLVFSFDEFKSVNSSTVRICSKAVIDKFNILRSSCSSFHTSMKEDTIVFAIIFTLLSKMLSVSSRVQF